MQLKRAGGALARAGLHAGRLHGAAVRVPEAA
jgi:hypothetical protein